MAKRKKCLNCKHADVIRYGRDLRRFPMGVYCALEKWEAGDDPRDHILPCDWHCERWHGKAKQSEPA